MDFKKNIIWWNHETAPRPPKGGESPRPIVNHQQPENPSNRDGQDGLSAQDSRDKTVLPQ